MSIEKVTAALDGKTQGLVGNKDIYSGLMKAPEESGAYNLTISAYDDAGNVSIADSGTNSDLLLDVTLWHTPKTNWKPTDRFNIEDYDRIKNNLAYLHEKAVELWKNFDIYDMGEDIKSYAAYWLVSVFNMFEKNLEIINQNIFTKDYGISQTFYENGPFIKWDELNRIESAILSMNILLQQQESILRRIPFRLGAYKEVSI